MEWRPLDKNSEYEVSNTGIIRKVQYKKAIKDKDGYLLTMITQNGKSRVRPIHRLVMHAFDPRPNEGELEVHHKDGNPATNALSNLCWCSHKENIDYIQNPVHPPKPVLQFSLAGEFLQEFSSLLEAERRTQISARRIGEVASGKRREAGGYIWKLAKSSTANGSCQADNEKEDIE